jgi:hypothetical protein
MRQKRRLQPLRPILAQNGFPSCPADVWMMRDPVPGDVFATANPYVVVLHDIIEKPFETDCPARMADEPHV